jgi:hypothetical protein
MSLGDYNMSNVSKYSESKSAQLRNRAEEIGKAVAELEPWVDYDPITMDEIAWQVHKGRSGVVWTGD